MTTKLERLQLTIDMKYDEKYLVHNTAQVVMVIDKSNEDKVAYVGVLTRASLSEWFFGKGQIYKDNRYDILIGNVNIAGKVILVARDQAELPENSEGGTESETTTKFVN